MDNKLNFYVNMRSNDVWYGLSYDVPFFTTVQKMMLLELKQHYPGLGLGHYVHDSRSLHVYEKDFERIEKISKLNKTIRTKVLPSLCYHDAESKLSSLIAYEWEKREGYPISEYALTSFEQALADLL